MKKSEALKALTQTLGTYDSWEEQCDYMLSVMGFIGMAPPERSFTVTKELYGTEYQVEIKERSWEPEDA